MFNTYKHRKHAASLLMQQLTLKLNAFYVQRATSLNGFHNIWDACNARQRGHHWINYAVVYLHVHLYKYSYEGIKNYMHDLLYESFEGEKLNAEFHLDLLDI